MNKTSNKKKIKLLLAIIVYTPWLLIRFLLALVEMTLCMSHYSKQRKLDIKRG